MLSLLPIRWRWQFPEWKTHLDIVYGEITSLSRSQHASCLRAESIFNFGPIVNGLRMF